MLIPIVRRAWNRRESVPGAYTPRGVARKNAARARSPRPAPADDSARVTGSLLKSTGSSPFFRRKKTRVAARTGHAPGQGAPAASSAARPAASHCPPTPPTHGVAAAGSGSGSARPLETATRAPPGLPRPLACAATGPVADSGFETVPWYRQPDFGGSCTRGIVGRKSHDCVFPLCVRRGCVQRGGLPPRTFRLGVQGCTPERAGGAAAARAAGAGICAAGCCPAVARGTPPAAAARPRALPG